MEYFLLSLLEENSACTVQYFKSENKSLNVSMHLRILMLMERGCADRPDAERGSWNAAGVKFYKPAPLTSFAVASFVPEHRVSGMQDSGSIQVRCFSHTTDRINKTQCRFTRSQIDHRMRNKQYAHTRSELKMGTQMCLMPPSSYRMGISNLLPCSSGNNDFDRHHGSSLQCFCLTLTSCNLKGVS